MKIKSFKEYSKKTAFKYSIITVIIIVILVFSISIMFFRSVEKKSAQKSEKNLKSTLDTNFNKILFNIENIEEDRYFMGFLKGEISRENLLYEFFQFRKSLKINLDFILYKNDQILLSTIGKSDLEKIFSIINWERYKVGQNVDFVVDYDTKINKALLQFEKEIKLKDDTYKVIFDLDESSIDQLLNTEMTTINFILGSYDQVLSTNYTNIKGKADKFLGTKLSNELISLNDKNYYFSSEKINSLDIKIYSLYEKNELQNLFYYFLGSVLLIVSICLLVINFTWDIISKKNNEALNIMVKAFKKNKDGNLAYQIDSPVFEEFQDLYKEYNNMLKSIEKLIEKNKEISHLNRVDYLRLLNSQFNPHFLFNTLESLRYLTIFDPKKASKFIVDLAKILRSTIDNKGFYSKVQDEVENLESYLRLQKIRYEDNLEYEIRVKDSVLMHRIPRHVIQPIIENSIKYTYKEQNNLTLSISILDSNDKLKILIKDNGPGIDPLELDKLKSNFKNYSSQMGLGFFNVNKKLDLLYKDYTFDIKNLDVGLLIEIEIGKEIYV